MGAEPPHRRAAKVRIGGTAYGVAAVGILVACAQDVADALLWLHDFSDGRGMFALGLAAVAFASFGPFVLSLGCWHLAKRVDRKWAVHLLFIPCAYAIVRAGALVLGYADGRTGTDEPANFALVAAFLLFCLTTLVHAAALIGEIFAAISRRRVSGR